MRWEGELRGESHSIHVGAEELSLGKEPQVEWGRSHVNWHLLDIWWNSITFTVSLQWYLMRCHQLSSCHQLQDLFSDISWDVTSYQAVISYKISSVISNEMTPALKLSSATRSLQWYLMRCHQLSSCHQLQDLFSDISWDVTSSQAFISYKISSVISHEMSPALKLSSATRSHQLH